MTQKIGIIGGGLYNMPGLINVEEISVTTPFGNPSANITRSLEGIDAELFFAEAWKRTSIKSFRGVLPR